MRTDPRILGGLRRRALALGVLPLVAALRAHRLFLSPLFGVSCRFEPSCSRYAEEALRTHGLVHGLWLALARLGRCQPWGGTGFDPVPSPSRAGARDRG